MRGCSTFIPPWWLSSKESACQCLPVQETWVWFLGGEDPLEKEMAIHSSILAWKIPRTEELGRLQSIGSQRVGHDLGTKQQLIVVQINKELYKHQWSMNYLAHLLKCGIWLTGIENNLWLPVGRGKIHD